MKNRIIIITVFVLPLLLYFACTNLMPDNNNVQQAIASSQTSIKGPAIIKFSAPLCIDCQTLDKTFTKIMPKYQNKVTLKKIDVSNQSQQNKQLIKEYNVTVVPTTVFINSQNNVINRIEGDIAQNKLESIIKAL